MTTTTIRIDDDLKERVVVAAERAGMTTHAFIVESIARTVAHAEEDGAFCRIAESRRSHLFEAGKTVPWAAAKAYLEARVRGGKPPKPAARKPGH